MKEDHPNWNEGHECSQTNVDHTHMHFSYHHLHHRGVQAAQKNCPPASRGSNFYQNPPQDLLILGQGKLFLFVSTKMTQQSFHEMNDTI